MRLTVIEPADLSPIVIDDQRRIWERYWRPHGWKGSQRWKRSDYVLMDDNRTRKRDRP